MSNTNRGIKLPVNKLKPGYSLFEGVRDEASGLQFRAGAVNYIRKPFEPGKVAKIVERVFAA
jgi:hypothetical protein